MPAWKDATPSPDAAPARGLVRRRGTAALFRTARFPAGPALEPWVAYLWTVDWDLPPERGAESTVISFPALHLTAEWGGPGERRHGHALPATLVHGPVSRVFRVWVAGRGAVVGARWRPGGALAWTRTPGERLRDRAVAAAGLGPPLPEDLHTGSADLPAPERADAFRAALAGRLPEVGGDAEMDALVERMEADPGLVRVEQVAALAGCSTRTLQRRFARHLGLGPKWVLARFRLQEAALALERDPAVDLAALAAALGFYDQSHLTHALRDLLGETPASYAARAART